MGKITKIVSISISLIVLSGIFFGFQNFTSYSTNQAHEAAVNWDSLSQELEGFAFRTTGGLGGELYDVTTEDDYESHEKPIKGTLRFAVENVALGKPLWIRFAIGKNQPTQIRLKRTLNLRSNLSIDGRGSNVAIVSVVDWSKYKVVPGNKSRRQCAPINPQSQKTTLFSIASQKNIIITGLQFERINFEKSPWEKTDPELDKECLGDVISIYNTPSVKDYWSSQIWINRNSFKKCGDGCIDVIRPVPGKAHLISISNNSFIETDKTMILGTPYDFLAKAKPGESLPHNIPDGKYYYRVSLYGNLFDRVHERNPRVSHAIVHIYKNTFRHWTQYLIAADAAKVFFESNQLIPLFSDSIVINSYLKDSVYSSGNINSMVPLQKSVDQSYKEYRGRWIHVPHSL